MSIEKYNQIVEAGNTLVFPKKQLAEVYDTVLVTGEVSWARTEVKQLKEKDKKLYVSIKISDKDFETLSSLDLPDNRVLSGLKEVELPVPELGDDGEPLKDENGDTVYKKGPRGKVVKEFAYCQITISQNRSVKDKDSGEMRDVVIPVIDADTGEHITGILADGCKVTVLGSAYHTSFEGTNYLGLNLREVRVHDLKLYEAAKQDDGWDLLGMDNIVAAAPPVASQSSSESTQQESKQETPEDPLEELSGGPSEEFDEEVPF